MGEVDGGALEDRAVGQDPGTRNTATRSRQLVACEARLAIFGFECCANSVLQREQLSLHLLEVGTRLVFTRHQGFPPRRILARIAHEAPTAIDSALLARLTFFQQGLHPFHWNADENSRSLGGHYAFSKQAISSWVVSQAPELASQGLRINALCPGMTETPMMPDFEKTVGDQLAAFPCPIGRRSTPEEQARAMLSLNNRESSYLTGIEFFNDGGASAIMNLAGAEALVSG